MHTQASLMEDLQKSAINKENTLLIHSSMKAIGEVEGGGDAVLDALIEFMKEGLLLFPTHTWEKTNCINGIYDYKSEPSCVGYLTRLFMTQKGAVRSLHPSHSVTAIGKRAEEYVKYDDEAHTPCHRSGCMGHLYDEHAQILFLGTKLTKNTFIHGIEEWLDIPDRINPKMQIYKVVQRDGSIKEVEYHGHLSSFGDVSSTYDKISDALFVKGFASEFKFGDARCILVDVREMADLVVSFLERDPNLFGHTGLVPKEWYE